MKKNNNKTAVAATNAAALADDLKQFEAACAEVDALTETADERNRKALLKAHECGTILLRMKARMPHGEWESWAEKNVTGMSKSARQGWMVIAAKTQTSGFLKDAKSVHHAMVLLGLVKPYAPRKALPQAATLTVQVTAPHEQPPAAAPVPQPVADKCQSVQGAAACFLKLGHNGPHSDGVDAVWPKTDEERLAALAKDVVYPRESMASAQPSSSVPSQNPQVAIADLAKTFTEPHRDDDTGTLSAQQVKGRMNAEIHKHRAPFVLVDAAEEALHKLRNIGDDPDLCERLCKALETAKTSNFITTPPPRVDAAAVTDWFATDEGEAWLKAHNDKLLKQSPPRKLDAKTVNAWIEGDLAGAGFAESIYDKGFADGRKALPQEPAAVTAQSPEQRRAAERAEREANDIEGGRCVRIPTGPPFTVKLMAAATATLRAMIPKDANHIEFADALSTAAAAELKLAQSKGRKEQPAFSAYT